MIRVTRQSMVVSLAMGIIVAVSLVGLGCSKTPARPPELDEARMAYAQAQQDLKVATYAPVPLREAQEALLHAEQVWDKDKDVREVQNQAAVAKRRVEVARAMADKKLAETEIEQLGTERHRLLLEARTMEAQRARQEAEQARREAESYKQLR